MKVRMRKCKEASREQIKRRVKVCERCTQILVRHHSPGIRNRSPWYSPARQNKSGRKPPQSS